MPHLDLSLMKIPSELKGNQQMAILVPKHFTLFWMWKPALEIKRKLCSFHLLIMFKNPMGRSLASVGRKCDYYTRFTTTSPFPSVITSQPFCPMSLAHGMILLSNLNFVLSLTLSSCLINSKSVSLLPLTFWKNKR